MTPAAAFVLAKAGLDLAATIAFLIGKQPAMALMFMGFVIADAGALWLAL